MKKLNFSKVLTLLFLIFVSVSCQNENDFFTDIQRSSEIANFQKNSKNTYLQIANHESFEKLIIMEIDRLDRVKNMKATTSKRAEKNEIEVSSSSDYDNLISKAGYLSKEVFHNEMRLKALHLKELSKSIKAYGEADLQTKAFLLKQATRIRYSDKRFLADEPIVDDWICVVFWSACKAACDEWANGSFTCLSGCFMDYLMCLNGDLPGGG